VAVLTGDRAALTAPLDPGAPTYEQPAPASSARVLAAATISSVPASTLVHSRRQRDASAVSAPARPLLDGAV
jgi:hypothetical protein